MNFDDRVLIAGAGPVGLVAAANLVRKGVPVAVFEAGHELSQESRASTRDSHFSMCGKGLRSTPVWVRYMRALATAMSATEKRLLARYSWLASQPRTR